MRQKLRTASPGWSYIHTHFGVGYRFAPELEVGELSAADRVGRAGAIDREEDLDPALAG